MDPIRRQVHPRIQRRRDLAYALNFPAELKEKFGKFTDSQLAVLRGSRHKQGGRYNTINVSAEWRAWLDRYGDAPPAGPRP